MTDDLVNEFFPLTGPHTTETTIGATAAIDDLWRYLGHATQGYAAKIESLEDPADVYDLLGNVSSSEHRAASLLERLAHWADYIGARSAGTDHYGHTDDDGAPDTVESTMTRIAADLRDASQAHLVAARHLDLATGRLGYVYRNDTES